MIRTVRSPAAPGRSRIYEKLISDLLQATAYDSIAELVAEAKDRCARLRIPYASHEVDQALTVMRERLQREVISTPRPPTPTPEPAPLSKAEAAAALATLRARLGVPTAAPKVVPAVPVVSDRQADRARAFALVVQGIKAQTAVCRALDQAPPDAEDPECAR